MIRDGWLESTKDFFAEEELRFGFSAFLVVAVGSVFEAVGERAARVRKQARCLWGVISAGGHVGDQGMAYWLI